MKIAVRDFNLEATLDSGQVFGFVKNSGSVYEGEISGIHVMLSLHPEHLSIETNGSQVSERAIRAYFNLDHDMAPVYELLLEDDRLKLAYQEFKGLRIIRQDPWEALACFIISSKNNIKRIRKIRRNLSSAFCESPFRFPEARKIAQSNEGILKQLGLGYRAPFLLAAAKRVVQDGNLFSKIRKKSYREAKNELMNFRGVGEKVADCALLFGFQKYEAFPVDVWIYRAMRKLYFRNRMVSERRVREFGQRRWGKCAGYIQQYLYHGVKSNIW